MSIALSWLLLPPEVGVNRHGLNSIESVNHSPSPLLFSPIPTASPVHALPVIPSPLHLAPLTVSLPFQYTHKHSSPFRQGLYTRIANCHIQRATKSFVLFFFLSVGGFLQSSAQPQENAARPLQRGAGHIKGTPPC